MAIWILIGVPLALFLIGVWLHLNGTFAEEEKRFPHWINPSPADWRRMQQEAAEIEAQVLAKQQTHDAEQALETPTTSMDAPVQSSGATQGKRLAPSGSEVSAARFHGNEAATGAAPSPMSTRRIATIALTAALLALALQGWTLYQDHRATARAHAAAESQYAYAAYMKAADPTFDVDCSDFAPAGDAQAFFDAGRRIHGKRADQFHLDSNGNGKACELIGTAYGDIWEDAATGGGTGGLRRWWSVDKDCSSFASRVQAVDLFQMLGGDRYDPFNLDADKDGDPCEPAS